MKKLLLSSVLAFASIGAQAAEILITQFDSSPGYNNISNALNSLGHSVDIVDVRTGGTLASTLAGKSYDQVFLFDLTSTQYLNGTDTQALGSFWNAHRGLVVDTRSYGYHFQGTDPSEVALIQNVSDNFLLTGGGVWVGTDHDPSWTRNANPFLAEIGVDLVTGSFSNPVNFADPTSVLLSGVTPTDLWGGGQSVGQAPIGIQPNGIEMFIHFGHTRTDGSILPYISASFPLQGPPPVDPPPEPIPAPMPLLLIGIGFLAMRLARR